MRCEISCRYSQLLVGFVFYNDWFSYGYDQILDHLVCKFIFYFLLVFPSCENSLVFKRKNESSSEKKKKRKTVVKEGHRCRWLGFWADLDKVKVGGLTLHHICIVRNLELENTSYMYGNILTSMLTYLSSV